MKRGFNNATVSLKVLHKSELKKIRGMTATKKGYRIFSGLSKAHLPLSNN
jgi:hypothetical protein